MTLVLLSLSRYPRTDVRLIRHRTRSPAIVRAPLNAPDTAETRSRISALDGIRGVAISTVLIYHTFYVFADVPTGSAAAYLLSLTRLWWNGVDLFFVLSGFLIGGILIDAKQSASYFRTFYVRRAFRILPLYFAVLAATAVGLRFLPPIGETFPAFAYLALLQNFWAAGAGNFGMAWLSCTWSLAIEEQFYLIAPAIVRMVTARTLGIITAATIVAAPLLRVIAYQTLEHGAFASHVLMFTRADVLMFGVGAAVIVRNPRIASFLRRRLKIPGAIALASAAIVTIFTLRNWTIGSFQMLAFGYSIQGILFSTILLIAVLNAGGIVARILSAHALGFLGRRAYGIYLFHVPALYLAFLIAKGTTPHMRSTADFALGAFSALSAIAAAVLSWKYFEKPLVKRGHKWTY